MATTKNITMKQFNGTDYDTLYPKTLGSQITGAVPVASGGTGGTTAKAGMYNLLNGMSAVTPATNDLFPFKDVSGSTSGLVTLTNLITAMGNNGVITTSNLDSYLDNHVSSFGYGKIQAGTYAGTGTVGSSNPNTLTFNFEPKLVAVFPSDGSAGSPTFMFCTMDSQQSWDEECGGQFIKITFNGNTVSWYSTGKYWQGTSSGIQSADASGQLNTSGVTYRYFAIG